MGHFCNVVAYQSSITVYDRYEQRPQHRWAVLCHARAASQVGEQPELHAARAKLSPVLNQLIWFG